MKKADFNLRKLKIDSKTVITTYNRVGIDEDIQSTKKNIPHPDMRSKLMELRPIIADIFNMEGDAFESFNINGIVVSTLKGHEQIMILGNYVTRTGHKITINTHNIGCDGSDYLLQEKLSEFIKEITDEVYQYLFGNKQGQLEMELEEVEEKEKV